MDRPVQLLTTKRDSEGAAAASLVGRLRLHLLDHHDSCLDCFEENSAAIFEKLSGAFNIAKELEFLSLFLAQFGCDNVISGAFL